MGHAGAIISGSSGTAAAKKEALEAKGVRVGESPTEAAQIAVEVLGSAGQPRPGAAARASLGRAALLSVGPRWGLRPLGGRRPARGAVLGEAVRGAGFG